MPDKPYVVFVSAIQYDAVEVVGLPKRKDGSHYGSFRRAGALCWQFLSGREWYDVPETDLLMLERLYQDYQERHGAYD